jgi:hypothetical protein
MLMLGNWLFGVEVCLVALEDREFCVDAEWRSGICVSYIGGWRRWRLDPKQAREARESNDARRRPSVSQEHIT